MRPKMVGLSGELADGAFAGPLERWQNQDRLDEIVERWTRERAADEAVARLQRAGVPIVRSAKLAVEVGGNAVVMDLVRG